jgi:hypothetical protein
MELPLEIGDRESVAGIYGIWGLAAKSEGAPEGAPFTRQARLKDRTFCAYLL